MKRVLIIEDEHFTAQVMARIFHDLSFQTNLCFDFESAFEITGGNDKVDLVVTDIFMPGMGGIAGIQQLQKDLAEIPIIAMSGGWDEMNAEQTLMAAQKIGAKAGLKKPVSKAELVTVLRELNLLNDN